MDDLDAIIDRHVMVKPKDLEKALVNVAKSFDERYKCIDGYAVAYNEAAGKALYYFPGHGHNPIETVISPAQRDYLISIDYWQRV